MIPERMRSRPPLIVASGVSRMAMALGMLLSESLLRGDRLVLEVRDVWPSVRDIADAPAVKRVTVLPAGADADMRHRAAAVAKRERRAARNRAVLARQKA